MSSKSKVNDIVKLYGRHCLIEPLFKKGRPTPSFWRLRAFFNKQDESRLDKILEYLNSKDRHQMMSLTELINNADKYNLDRKWEIDKKQQDIKKEDAYNLDSFLSL